MSSDADLLETTRSMLRILSRSSGTSDFCRALVHQSLAPQGAVAAFVCRLDYDGNLKFVGRYGYNAKAFHGEEVISIWEPRIITDSIRENRMIFAENRARYLELYPKNVNLNVPGDGFAGIPLSRDGQAVGGMGIAFAGDLSALDTHPEFWSTLQLVAESHFVPLWATEAMFATSSNGSVDPEQLSTRQLQILSHIAEGRTNLQIARLMLLSESSIKQETVRIFRALGVANRKQAAIRGEVLGLIKAN